MPNVPLLSQTKFPRSRFLFLLRLSVALIPLEGTANPNWPSAWKLLEGIS